MGELRVAVRGFTLIELMVAIAVVAILAAIALPSYTSYIKRSRVPAGLDALSSYAVRMEQFYQDTGSYAKGDETACAVTVPKDVANYTFTCTLIGDDKHRFKATATGTGVLDKYIYSIDYNGVRKTESHPASKPAQDCWTVRGSTCDA